MSRRHEPLRGAAAAIFGEVALLGFAQAWTVRLKPSAPLRVSINSDDPAHLRDFVPAERARYDHVGMGVLGTFLFLLAQSPPGGA
jgi:hypothetical protein